MVRACPVRALQRAQLPEAAIKAFAAPLDLQVRWAKHLTDAMQKDPDRMLAVARELAADRKGLAQILSNYRTIVSITVGAG